MDRLVASERPVITVDDVLDTLAVSRATGNSILSRLNRKGWLQRLKRGAYAVVQLGAGTDSPAAESAWPIAAKLFAPCLISGWSACEHWGLTDQIFNVVSLVTAHPQRRRDQRVGGVRFRVRTLPMVRLFGGENVWFGSVRVQVADPHRTMIDIMDAPSFGGGGRHMLDAAKEYWSGSLCEPDAALKYANRFGRGTVFKRLGLMAERYGTPSTAWVRECRSGCSSGISLLDPDSPARGPIVSRWGLRVNLPMESE